MPSSGDPAPVQAPVRAADTVLIHDLHPMAAIQGHPPRRDHPRREPLLPGHALRPARVRPPAAALPRRRPRPTTRRASRPAATSSAASPATTPTATECTRRSTACGAADPEAAADTARRSAVARRDGSSCVPGAETMLSGRVVVVVDPARRPHFPSRGCRSSQAGLTWPGAVPSGRECRMRWPSVPRGRHEVRAVALEGVFPAGDEFLDGQGRVVADYLDEVAGSGSPR